MGAIVLHQGGQKRKIESEEGICQSPDIAKDLMLEILSRLPIKCLLRFKCVSKYWFKLISSSDFTKLYLQKACDDANYSYHKLLYMDTGDDSVPTFRYTPLYPILRNPRLHDKLQVDIFYPKNTMKFLLDESLEFVGSCNGLVCITGCKNKVLIWNPVIRKCIRLPSFGRRSPIFYGFGYDELSDDYKVVGIGKTFVKMYSAKSNSWKKLRDNVEVNEVDCNGCFLNGKIHWATKKNIFTIDLSTDLSSILQPPDCVQECSDWKVHVVGEHLVVFCYYRLSHVDMWMMMRYGVQDSWNKVNKRYPLDSFYDPRRCFRHIPCFVSKQGAKDGEILLHRLYVSSTGPEEPSWRLLPIRGSTSMRLSRSGLSGFLLYNHKTDCYSYNNPRVPNANLPLPPMPVIVYVESLIWPFP